MRTLTGTRKTHRREHIGVTAFFQISCLGQSPIGTDSQMMGKGKKEKCSYKTRTRTHCQTLMLGASNFIYEAKILRVIKEKTKLLWKLNSQVNKKFLFLFTNIKPLITLLLDFICEGTIIAT